MLISVLTAATGGSFADSQSAVYAAARDDVHPSAASVYLPIEADTGVPWELLASIAHTQTKNGVKAPDGKPRAWPQDRYTDDLVASANQETGQDTSESSGTTTTVTPDTSTPDTSAPDTSEPDEETGSLMPVADPPIVDGDYAGMFLINTDTWAAYATDPTVDVQSPEASAVFIAATLRTHLDDNSTGESLSFEGGQENWVEAILALPVKGLAGNETNKRVAVQIYETALAWMNGNQACGTSPSGLGAAGLPTAGPVKIGDTLLYKGHGIVFTEEAWQHAVTVAQVAAQLGLPDRAIIIAIATIIPETNFVNLPGGDRDSAGLFQQRPSAGWGTQAEVTNPEYAVRAFFGGPNGPNYPSPRGLLDLPGWETMEPGAAAQKVQASAHPDRYAEALPDAVGIMATLTANGYGSGGTGPSTDTSTDTGTGTGTTSTTVPSTDTTEPGTAPTPPLPTGTAATATAAFVIGDSLTVGADTAGLPDGWTVNGEVGRSTETGVGILESTDLSAHDAVVIALGANDTALDQAAMTELINRAMTKIGATTPTYWVNVDTGSPGLAGAADGVNPAIAAAAATHPNLNVGDWAAKTATIEGFDAMRAEDGIHYTPDGYSEYAKFLSELPAGATTPETCSSAQPGAGVVIDINTGLPIELCPIQNARTNCQIVDELTAMIAAAAADGTTLTVGNSFRDAAQQIDLRKKHCGTSHYAIYEMSSSACRPPTARPGSSQHEKGLAIDFASCSSRSTACYQWLAANAARFGFKNLPSEAWHWSVNGN